MNCDAEKRGRSVIVAPEASFVMTPGRAIKLFATISDLDDGPQVLGAPKWEVIAPSQVAYTLEDKGVVTDPTDATHLTYVKVLTPSAIGTWEVRVTATDPLDVSTMDSAFLDYNNNFSFDASLEKRQRWNLGVAVEGPKLKDKDGKDKDGFRALVFSDADLFADALVQSGMGRAAVVLVSGPLLDDSIRWLGGEEQFVGEAVSEDDKPIKHTKDQEAKWFTLTIIGGPVLVLVLGLVGTWARRRRFKPSEVKP